MTRHLAIFIATFALGAVIAVTLRSATHRPYQQRHDHAAPAAAPADEHADHQAPPATAPPAVPAPEHAGHHPGPAAAAPPAAAGKAVNSICAICGMPVDPALGTIPYKGRLIGFGCKTCPAKFRADPAKYGEAALLNQVVE